MAVNKINCIEEFMIHFTDLDIINQAQGHRIILLSFMRVKDE